MKKEALKKVLTLVILTFSVISIFAQSDSVIFINDDYITGEVESMDRGIIAISTDYSDSDFMIEWEKVREIYTTTVFIVALKNGDQHVSAIETVEVGKLRIIPAKGDPFVVNQDDVVNLNPISSSFLDRLSANIDVGMSLTKAQNVRQYSVRSKIGYETPKWSTDISFNSNKSNQDAVEPTSRTDGAVNFRYNLPRKLYAIATVSLLSNTEQLLDIRANTQLGLGAYVLRTNRAFWGAKLGANRNLERYVDPADDRESWEGFVGTELNLYDIGDLSLQTDVILYPGITEKGRWRSDVGFDVKYEFPMDFYVALGFSLNWDNKPAGDSSPTDYVFQAGFGWEW